MRKERKLGCEEMKQAGVGEAKVLDGLIVQLNVWRYQKEEDAKTRGEVVMDKALETGRMWATGDGF